MQPSVNDWNHETIYQECRFFPARIGSEIMKSGRMPGRLHDRLNRTGVYRCVDGAAVGQEEPVLSSQRFPFPHMLAQEGAGFPGDDLVVDAAHDAPGDPLFDRR